MKTCIRCQLEQPTSEFYVDRARQDGLTRYCKTCSKAKASEWSKMNTARVLQSNKRWAIANPEKVAARKTRWLEANRDAHNARNRAWATANPEANRAKRQRYRARLRQVSTCKVPQEFLKRLYASPCFYCGSTDRIEADHVLPLARGGRHSIGNLVAACKTCNTSKQDRTIMEWRLSSILKGAHD